MTKPAYLNTFVYLLYRFLKVLVIATFKLFFSRTTFINRHLLNIDRPTILVSNHPNTLLDPLNAAAYADRVVFFLANAGVFKKGFAEWFLENTYAIPIERPQDVEGRRIDNAESFARCDAFLAKSGCLYIAPQGGSSRLRTIGKVKSGTARIALSAENKKDFTLNLQILPLGLIYSAPGNFRSEVLINVGEPINVADYQSDYQNDAVLAAKKLTLILRERMEQLILNTQTEEEDQLLYKLETIIDHDNPLPIADRFYRSQSVLRNLQQLQPSQFLLLKKQADQYFETLDTLQIDDKPLKSVIRNQKVNWAERIIGFPFFLYGWINNIIPAWIPGWLTRKLKLYVGYDSTVKVLASLLTFPVFYSLQTFFIHRYFQNSWLTLIYILSLIPAGLFAWGYYQRTTEQLRRSAVRQINNNHPDVFKTLIENRRQLSEKLKTFYSATGS